MGNNGEHEFGIDTRKQSQEGKLSFRPPCSAPAQFLLSKAPTIPAGKLRRGEPTPWRLGSARVFPKLKRSLLEGEGIHVNKQLRRFMGRSSTL